MLNNLTGWHAVILLVIILLLFGAPKLPALAKSLGQSMKIFKAEVKSPAAEDADRTDLRADNRTTTTDGHPGSVADERTPGSQPQHKP